MRKLIIFSIVSIGFIVCLLLATNEMESLNLKKTHRWWLNRTGPHGTTQQMIDRSCTTACEVSHKGKICGPESNSHCCPSGTDCWRDWCIRGQTFVPRLNLQVSVIGASNRNCN